MSSIVFLNIKKGKEIFVWCLWLHVSCSKNPFKQKNKSAQTKRNKCYCSSLYSFFICLYQGSAWDGMGRKKSSHGMNFLEPSHGMGLFSKIFIPWWDGTIFNNFRPMMGWDGMGWDGMGPSHGTSHLSNISLKKYNFLAHLLIRLTLSVIKLFHSNFIILL